MGERAVERYERGESRYPFTPYPTGWFRLAYSDALATGEVKALHRFGRELVLFRTEEGRAVAGMQFRTVLQQPARASRSTSLIVRCREPR